MRVLLAALALACAGAAGADAITRAAEAFERDFHAELSARGVPGAAFAAVRGGQLLRLGLHGHVDQAGSRPIDSRTKFRVASLSKGFSGVLAATLAAEARFALDQPVEQHVPGLRLADGPSGRHHGRSLTIEDVLGQRSGFVRNAYDNLLEAGLSREEILPRFSTLTPLCAPGSCYSYQNNVFSLIEDVVASTVGKPYEQVVRDRLFEPLGMHGASTGYAAFSRATNRAEPHLKTRTGWAGVRPRTTYYQVPSAAGINAGIVDMAQWAVAMLGHRPEVIAPAVIDEVARPRIRTRNELRNRHWRDIIQDAHYGLGWRIYDLGRHRLLLHGGWVAGYRAEIAINRELDLGLVLLANAETRAVGALNRQFWDRMFQAHEAVTPPYSLP